MKEHNPISSDFNFQNAIFNFNTYKGSMQKPKREIRVRNFGKWDGNGMNGYELDHNSDRFIVV